MVKQNNRLACMADHEIDHEFFYNNQGEVDILLSPFFDPNWEYDDSVESYFDRILYQLTETIEEQRLKGHWFIASRPLNSPLLTTSPAKKALRVTCLTMASLGLLLPFLR
ncbi:hypothetical protein M5K25_013169 [Dendrobium thyrsiflorum]|uniref:Uncharacterized protein n=1 Tax=Dendrobium thyrsiflorum TaxID=117978 RepID=A0ABD0UZP0_DENTH